MAENATVSPPDDTKPDGEGAGSGKKKRRRADEPKQTHACEWDGCDKTFSRVDHLRRHFLNHQPAQIYNCDRCNKVFVRADLLLRHIERHDRRESSVILPGSTKPVPIIQAAQQYAAPVPPNVVIKPSQSTTLDSSSWQHPAPLRGSAPQPHTQAPLDRPIRGSFNQAPSYYAPSTSSAASTSATQASYPNSHYASTSEPANGDQLASFLAASQAGTSYPSLSLPQQYPPLPNPSQHYTPSPHLPTVPPLAPPSVAGSSTSSHTGLPGIEDPLNFLQASYGAPFVSAGEYDWLFDASGNFDVTLGSSRPASPGGGPEEDWSRYNFNNLTNFDFSSADIDVEASIASANQNHGQIGIFEEAPTVGLSVADDDASMPSVSPAKTDEDQTTPIAGLNMATPQQPGMDISPTAAPPESHNPLPPAQPTQPQAPKAVAIQFTTPSASPPAGSTTHIDYSTHVDVPTRLALLDYLGPEFAGLRADRRMGRGKMAEYLGYFWENVHETQIPVLHRATFRCDSASPPLLISMMILGCYFAEADTYQLALQLHSHLRGKVLCSPDFKPRASLWLHQTELLITVFGKLCANRLGHEMAHIHWSSVVTLARRSGLYSQRYMSIPEEHKNNLEIQWAYWIEEESAKRLAHAQFAVDVEHAAFFRHSPTLSAFQIQLCLPCDEDEWEASTAEEWAQLHAEAKPPIPFISALKASLVQDVQGVAPPLLNPFARISILHGLISVAQDLQWRDHVIGLSQPDRKAANWRDMISAAYNGWKARLDAQLLQPSPTWQASQLLRASISLYAAAHITLAIDIHELQIAAGAESALGLVVSQPVFEATTARIGIWSNSRDGRAATWHAAHFLRSSLQHHFGTGQDLSRCLHHRWAVYIATLTLFCYGTSMEGQAREHHQNADVRQATMRYLDAMCTNTPEALVAVARKNDVIPLLQTVYSYIQDSRWEIAQEGAKILRRLITNSE